MKESWITCLVGILIWATSMAIGQAQSQLRPWPEYQVIMWEGPSASKQPEKYPLYYQRLREMGVSAGMVFGDGNLVPVIESGMPYYVENMVNRGLCLKFSSSVTDWESMVTRWKEQRREAECVRDYCLDDPQWLAEARRHVTDLVQKNRQHHPLLYNLRDELSVTISANPFDYDFHHLALESFRRWLRERYQTLEELNSCWETEFTKWDEVRPFTTDRIKNRMASGLALPQGLPDWHAVQRIEFDPQKASIHPTAWNFSPWADHRSYMDESLARTLDDLRNHARALDRQTPVGIEGTQMPSAFGGYDLWKLSQALDWVEPYDVCDARAIFGSFMPGKVFLSTVGESNAREARRRLWHLLLEGDRGCLVWWSEDCFDWSSPDLPLTRRAIELSGVLNELRSPLASLFLKAERIRDPIAIHYSHPSIQVAWLMESTVDGSTWLRRFSSHEAIHNRHAKVRHAWLRLLQDAGFDPVFVSTDQIERGELSKFQALVLPQSWAISNEESDEIRRFLGDASNRVLLADGQAGMFDEHARFRQRPSLDDWISASAKPDLVIGRTDSRSKKLRFLTLPKPVTEYLSNMGDSAIRDGWIHPCRDDWLSRIPRFATPISKVPIRMVRYRLGDKTLLAIEQNRSYQMGENLRPLSDSNSDDSEADVELKLAEPHYIVDLRTGRDYGRCASIKWKVAADVPSILGLSSTALSDPTHALAEFLE